MTSEEEEIGVEDDELLEGLDAELAEHAEGLTKNVTLFLEACEKRLEHDPSPQYGLSLSARKLIDKVIAHLEHRPEHRTSFGRLTVLYEKVRRLEDKKVS